jgi:hypothetical protein
MRHPAMMLKVGFLLIVMVGAAGAANAQISATLDSPQCYENIGCPHKDPISEEQIEDFSCENLWLVRNTIFHQRGYCFQTPRGRANFDNSHCLADSVSELDLSPTEMHNVSVIREMERHKNCQ